MHLFKTRNFIDTPYQTLIKVLKNTKPYWRPQIFFLILHNSYKKNKGLWCDFKAIFICFLLVLKTLNMEFGPKKLREFLLGKVDYIIKHIGH